MAIDLCSALKINQWLGCRAAQPMAGKPTKARQNGQGIWLYNAGIRQGSSGYFDWSDDWVLQPHSTAKYTVLIPYLREPSTFSIDTTLRTASVKTLGEPVYFHVSMLGERPTLEFSLGTKRGSEGPSIVQGSPAEGNRVKLIEVDPALSNRPK